MPYLNRKDAEAGELLQVPAGSGYIASDCRGAGKPVVHLSHFTLTNMPFTMGKENKVRPVGSGQR